MSDANKAVIKRFTAEVWNKGNMEVADELLAADFADHNPPLPGLPHGLEEAKAVFTMFRAAFPDLKMETQRLIAEDDLVVHYWIARGTNTGELLGQPPSNKAVAVHGVDIVRMADGRIMERWGVFDLMSLMQQLGQAEDLG
jgi:steroid delta-isomerase-like uncharacterized protein